MASDSTTDSTPRELDVVVYGATGFVGKLTAAYLARNAPAGVRIGLGGRSRDKLERVRDGLGPAARDWPLLVADSTDPEALTALARRTTAVATTVGPFIRYGLPLVTACAAAGTHYADLTGEVTFVRRVIDTEHDNAVATGARLVSGCGFDAVPSDLGVLVVAEAARRDGAGELGETTLLVTGVRGGVSGGTFNTIGDLVAEMRTNTETRKLVTDPYALSPDRAAEPDLGPEPDPWRVSRDTVDGRWRAPFAMSSFNTRIVRRSNALSGYSYGRGFRYQEWLGFDGATGLAKAVASTAATGGLAVGLMLPPTRALLDRVLPDPGEGPSERTQQSGYFDLEINAETTTGARYRCLVHGDGDPGYAATAVMLGESALALALDTAALPEAAGALTPATGLGLPLVDRLRSHGFRFDVERLGD